MRFSTMWIAVVVRGCSTLRAAVRATVIGTLVCAGQMSAPAQVAEPVVLAYDGMELPSEPGNQLAPGNSTFYQSVPIAVAPGGTVAFASSTIGPAGPLGLFRTTPTGPQRIARPGMAVAGPAGNAPWILRIPSSPIAVNDQGDVLFIAYVTGAVGSQRVGLFLAQTDGAIQTLALGGEPVIDLPGWLLSQIEPAPAYLQGSRTLTQTGFATAVCDIQHMDGGRFLRALMGVSPNGIRVIATFGTDADADFATLDDLGVLTNVSQTGSCLFIADGALYCASVLGGEPELVFDPSETYEPCTTPAGAIAFAQSNEAGDIAVVAGGRLYVSRPWGFSCVLQSQQLVGQGVGRRRLGQLVPGSLTLGPAGEAQVLVVSLFDPPLGGFNNGMLEAGGRVSVEVGHAPVFTGVLGGEVEGEVGPSCHFPFSVGRTLVARNSTVQSYAIVVMCPLLSRNTAFMWNEENSLQLLGRAQQQVILPTGETRSALNIDVIGTGSSLGVNGLFPVQPAGLVRIARTGPSLGTFNGWVLIKTTPPVISCGDADFNRDGVAPDSRDLLDLLYVLANGMCPNILCDPIDINRDGVFPASDDIDAFLSVFAGGGC